MARLDAGEVDRRLEGSTWRREADVLVRDLRCPDSPPRSRSSTASRTTRRARTTTPDILVHGWNNVRLTLSTHGEGGITEADLRLAAAIDALA